MAGCYKNWRESFTFASFQGLSKPDSQAGGGGGSVCGTSMVWKSKGAVLHFVMAGAEVSRWCTTWLMDFELPKA